MGRQARAILGVLLATGILAVFASGANAASGSESFSGTIIAKADSSGNRTVLATVIRARGVFNGVGRVVEVDNLPGDPDNILRDDLVFAGGTMHLVTTVVDFEGSIDPRSCVGTATIQQTAVVAGGTGKFAAASGSFSGVLSGRSVLPRNPDGSCSDIATTIEIDQFSAGGTLSF